MQYVPALYKPLLRLVHKEDVLDSNGNDGRPQDSRARSVGASGTGRAREAVGEDNTDPHPL